MGRKKHDKFVSPGNKGKDRRHKMKGKSLETFTEEMHTVLQGKHPICKAMCGLRLWLIEQLMTIDSRF